MTKEQRINSEIEAASKRIDAYLRIAWIVAHCPSDSLVELLLSCFPYINV